MPPAVAFEPPLDDASRCVISRVRSFPEGALGLEGFMTLDLRDNLIGLTVGDYKILRAIGRGGMSMVYEAERAGKPAALKIPFAELRANADYLRRFQNEGLLHGRVKHGNIVEVYEVSVDPPFIAMELANGRDLAMIIRKDTMLHARQAVRIAIQVASALGAIHREGILHRDLKPKNIMVDDTGLAKLMDFGIAGVRSGEDPSESAADDWRGSLSYIPPEQLKGQTLDHRSDIYALGVTLFETIAGRPPFMAETDAELERRIKESPVLPTEAFNETSSEALDEILQKCLSKNPAERYVNALSLERDLKKALSELP